MEQRVSVFKQFNIITEQLTISEILERIKTGAYQKQIIRLRNLITGGRKKEYENLKKSLPAFTPSAMFEKGRKPELIVQYSGFVHLDFDKLKPDQLEKVFSKIIQMPYTYACFRSPTGNGLKVFVKVSTSHEEHSAMYINVQKHYEKIVEVESDAKCKDITRLCFVSYDPELYQNIKSKTFAIKTSTIAKELRENKNSLINSELKPEISSNQELFQECILFTEKKIQYLDGNRNNYIYHLACNCNRKGIPEEETYSLISSNYNLSEKEIRASVKSAYLHHGNEYAKFAKLANSAKSANLQTSVEEETSEDYFKLTPLIPDVIFNQLPDILQSGCSVFSDKRERDVFLTGALTILSGCLPNVKGVYDQQTVHPNMFAFIIAPAASGKSALKFAKNLADKHHAQTLQASREEMKHFESELVEFKNRQRNKKKSESTDEPPEKPQFKVLFIPANASYAKILWHIEQNDGDGIICETEADTMGNVMKQEWGGYSDMLRKAFHHERLSSSKKTNNEYIEVDVPRISVALSGTPSQVTGLIASSEDGLFSRFIFYAYKVNQLWRDVSPKANKFNLTDHFNSLSENVLQLIHFLNEYPTEISLSDKQWHTLNASCSNWLQDVIIFSGEDTGSIVKRLGLILFRITMIFTALRKFENGELSELVKCSDIDFNSALQLAKLYLDHSIFMFHNLPRQEETGVFKKGSNKKHFFDQLPNEFKRADAIEMGKKLNISNRSVDTLLKELLGKHLIQPQYGCYSKI